jgi:hypothetical protein
LPSPVWVSKFLFLFKQERTEVHHLFTHSGVPDFFLCTEKRAVNETINCFLGFHGVSTLRVRDSISTPLWYKRKPCCIQCYWVLMVITMMNNKARK